MKHIYGNGVLTRHSRRCVVTKSNGSGCNCEPSYEAWVWLEQRERKLRKTFHDYHEARRWRRDQLRRLYAAKTTPKTGNLDRAYGLLRKTAQELDASRSTLARRPSAEVGAILDLIYRAEDLLLPML